MELSKSIGASYRSTAKQLVAKQFNRVPSEEDYTVADEHVEPHVDKAKLVPTEPRWMRSWRTTRRTHHSERGAVLVRQVVACLPIVSDHEYDALAVGGFGFVLMESEDGMPLSIGKRSETRIVLCSCRSEAGEKYPWPAKTCVHSLSLVGRTRARVWS